MDAPAPSQSQFRTGLIALAAGLFWGLVCFGLATIFHLGAADFKHALIEGRDLLNGRDPYLHEPGPYWVPYPIPAALFAMPFAGLPDEVAAGLFMAISTGLLTWGILRTGETWRLAMLFSWPLLYSVLFAQWSPLLCAMWFFPMLAPLVLCKPNIALPFVLTSRANWKLAVFAFCVLAVSLILRPNWPVTWLEQTSGYQGRIPPIAVMPLGPLVLLNLLAWKDRRAWLVLTLALMPQRVFYDQLPLLLVAATNKELFWLVLGGWVGFFVLWISPSMAAMPGGSQLWVVLAHYLPATFVIARGPIKDYLSTGIQPFSHSTLLKTRGTIDK